MRHLFYIFLIFGILSVPNVAFSVEKQQGDYVVLLHGIARSSSHMESLAEYLQKQGYEVVNLDYPSTKHNMDELVDIIHESISKKITEDRPIHFVGYSMGALMTRAVIHKYRPNNLGRVVQLAPPNNGSELSDYFKDNWFYKKICGPAGQQLVTNDEEIQTLFGVVDYELGVIAGNSTVDPISSTIIPGDDDGKVSVKSTKLSGMKDHIVVAASHMFFPSNKVVLRQTESFLKNGEFQKQSGK